MGYFVGLDVGLKATRICVVDESERVVWEGVADTHPELIADRLVRYLGDLALVGLETGSMAPWVHVIKRTLDEASCDSGLKRVLSACGLEGLSGKCLSRFAL